MIIDSICLEDDWVQAFWLDLELSNTQIVAAMILELYMSDEKVYMQRLWKVEDKYFFFYIGVIEDFGVNIYFTLLQSDILKIIHFTRPNYIRTNGHSYEDSRFFVGAYNMHIILFLWDKRVN